MVSFLGKARYVYNGWVNKLPNPGTNLPAVTTREPGLVSAWYLRQIEPGSKSRPADDLSALAESDS